MTLGMAAMQSLPGTGSTCELLSDKQVRQSALALRRVALGQQLAANGHAPASQEQPPADQEQPSADQQQPLGKEQLQAELHRPQPKRYSVLEKVPTSHLVVCHTAYCLSCKCPAGACLATAQAAHTCSSSQCTWEVMLLAGSQPAAMSWTLMHELHSWQPADCFAQWQAASKDPAVDAHGGAQV